MSVRIGPATAEGILLFNRRQFFEAHEVWEDAWKNSRGDRKLLLHGLIQVAAGFHKIQCGLPKGAASLLDKGTQKLARLSDPSGRFDRDSLIASARSWQAAMGRAAGSFVTRPGAPAFPTLREPRRSFFCARVFTDVQIEASPARVWQVLIDFASYPAWNPFLRSIHGTPRPGGRLVVSMAPPGGRAMTFRPRVLRAEARRELRWKGRLLLPGLVEGEHVFSIAPLSAHRVRFSQRETFRGLLVPVLSRSVFEATRRGFEEMNRALMHRAASS